MKGADGDALLIAENLADDAVLMNARTGKVLQRFDLSAGKYVPTSFPYGVVVSRDGTRAWCSLWNASQVAELDLRSGQGRAADLADAAEDRASTPRRIPPRCC